MNRSTIALSALMFSTQGFAYGEVSDGHGDAGLDLGVGPLRRVSEGTFGAIRNVDAHVGVRF